MFGNLNPFNLSGPQFLQLYAICLGIIGAITIGWRILQWIVRTEPVSGKNKPLDVWDSAYLRGRDLAVAQTAVVELSTVKLIEPNKDKTKLVATTKVPNKQLGPVPFAIFRAAQSAGGMSAAKLHKEVAFECERIRDRLIDRGFMKSWSDRFWQVWPGYLGFGLLMAFGLIRMAVGINRDRPVGYLVLLLILTVLAGLALTCTSSITSAGKRALNESIEEMKKYQAKASQSTALGTVGVPSHEQFPELATWSFAVMGLATAQSMLDPSVAELIKKQGLANSESISGCGGGGGSGCGGGGGGCGGGGCGGCGS